MNSFYFHNSYFQLNKYFYNYNCVAELQFQIWWRYISGGIFSFWTGLMVFLTLALVYLMKWLSNHWIIFLHILFITLYMRKSIVFQICLGFLFFYITFLYFTLNEPMSSGETWLFCLFPDQELADSLSLRAITLSHNRDEHRMGKNYHLEIITFLSHPS